MTAYALAPRTIRRMVGVLLQCRCVGAVLITHTVTGGADFCHGLAQHSFILRAMRIMAGETGNASIIHQTLHVIVTLHAVLMRRGIREMGECSFTKLVLF